MAASTTIYSNQMKKTKKYEEGEECNSETDDDPNEKRITKYHLKKGHCPRVFTKRI